jgi:hypothetical protein
MMAVTYEYLYPGMPEVKLPTLHRVVYAHTVDGAMAAYQHSYKDDLVESWLIDNCKHPYYRNPGWTTEKFIEFECDQEAVMFALRWA